MGEREGERVRMNTLNRDKPVQRHKGTALEDRKRLGFHQERKNSVSGMAKNSAPS